MPKYLITVAQLQSVEWLVEIEADNVKEASNLAIARVYGDAPFDDKEQYPPLDYHSREPQDEPEAIWAREWNDDGTLQPGHSV
jgi:hypothetical protein